MQQSSQIYDKSLFQKYQKGSHSGYLDDQYQTTKDFPQIQQHHFRIQDDETIIQLQKLQKQSKPMNYVTYTKASDQFNSRMNSLLQGLDSQPLYKGFYRNNNFDNGFSYKNQTQNYNNQNNIKNKNFQKLSNDMIQQSQQKLQQKQQGNTKFYYSLNQDYDDQKALAQAYQRVQVQILQEKMEDLTLQNQPIFIKSKNKKKFIEKQKQKQKEQKRQKEDYLYTNSNLNQKTQTKNISQIDNSAMQIEIKKVRNKMAKLSIQDQDF